MGPFDTALAAELFTRGETMAAEAYSLGIPIAWYWPYTSAEAWDLAARTCVRDILSGIINQLEGDSSAMAATDTDLTDTADEAPTFASVFAECRDINEKVDLLAFAVEQLADEDLAQAAKDFKDNQLASATADLATAARQATSIEELKKRPGVQSAEQARALAEKEGLDLPDTTEGASVEEQVGDVPAPAELTGDEDELTDEDVEALADLSDEDLALLESLSPEDRDALRELRDVE